jgi:hypothetical protein
MYEFLKDIMSVLLLFGFAFFAPVRWWRWPNEVSRTGTCTSYQRQSPVN